MKNTKIIRGVGGGFFRVFFNVLLTSSQQVERPIDWKPAGRPAPPCRGPFGILDSHKIRACPN